MYIHIHVCMYVFADADTYIYVVVQMLIYLSPVTCRYVPGSQTVSKIQLPKLLLTVPLVVILPDRCC